MSELSWQVASAVLWRQDNRTYHRAAAGFIVPRALIPPWFRWYTYLDPIHWSLYGLVASQLGDVQDPLFLGPGLPQLTVEQFLDDYYDYQHSFLPWVAVILLGEP